MKYAGWFLAILSIFVVAVYVEIDPGVSRGNASPTPVTTAYYVKVRAALEGEADHKPFILTENAIRTGAKSFIGRSVLLDHTLKVSSIVGVVIDARAVYDEALEKWVIEAVFKVVDAKTIAKLKDGRLKFVSIGFDYEPADVTIVWARQLTWRKIDKLVGIEISFVAVPAIREAKILQRSGFKIEFSQ